MDLDRIKQNLRFRSGRTSNMSKRFPTREAEPAKAVDPPKPQQVAVPKRKPKGILKSESVPLHQNQRTAGMPKQATGKPSPASANNTTTDSAIGEEMPSPKPGQSPPDILMSGSGEDDFDLRPPAIKTTPASLESLTDLVFSEGYLRTLVSDPQYLARFTTFLSLYQPSTSHLVLQYIETQKIIKAVAYANAVAATLARNSGTKESVPAVKLTPSFKESSEHIFNTLLKTALPAWVTYNLVKTSTSCLTAEITNQSNPLTRDLVGGLSEVFCITDPNQKDNPIIYSSNEFYRLTGYGKDNVIGYNCRFLQGPKTKKESAVRLRKAIDNGEEISETLLNYRRDGKPFLNVLMLAPLHDNKGKVKYYLGAQVDASRLLEGGRGIEGFERYLVKKQMEDSHNPKNSPDPKQLALEKLRDLSMTFDLEESAVVQSSSRRNLVSGREGSVAGTEKPIISRRRIQEDDDSSDSEGSDGGQDQQQGAWDISGDIPTGKLPGIYKNYLLVRPFPSLRVIFTSQAAKSMGKLQQNPLFSHIAAPASTMKGLRECFQAGTPVTSKIALMAEGGDSREGIMTGRWGKKDDPSKYGKTCWISATPMLDADDRPGVWMVVIIDQASAGQTNTRLKQEERSRKYAQESESLPDTELPIKPKQVGLSMEEPSGKTQGHVAQHGQTDSGIYLDDDDNEEEKEEEVSRQRSAESQHTKQTERADDIPRTESPSGLPAHDYFSKENQSSIQDKPEPTTPQVIDAEVEDQETSETTPRQAATRTGTDVRLRKMDYLSSRSSASRNRVNSEINEKDERYWNVASPYSID